MELKTKGGRGGGGGLKTKNRRGGVKGKERQREREGGLKITTGTERWGRGELESEKEETES